MQQVILPTLLNYCCRGKRAEGTRQRLTLASPGVDDIAGAAHPLERKRHLVSYIFGLDNTLFYKVK